MKEYAKIIYIYYFFVRTVHAEISEADFLGGSDIITLNAFVYWPNGTIPFYITPEHFDHEQSLKIMTALSMFTFKTCLKFAPALVPPDDTHHVLVFENPGGVRKCVIGTEGHPREGPHRVTLGYNCIQSPQIDMIIMKALGFGFEHNRASRDLYIDVQLQNVEPSAMDLFAKDNKLPLELRSLPYDVDSVMHFRERDYSKNGHRTIIFKHHKPQQRTGLSPLDLRKIEIVYGPECRRRDRQEKIELCQNYPGVARRKREVVEPPVNKSLRVNPNITPPPDVLNDTDDIEVVRKKEVDDILKDLGVEEEVDGIVERINKVSSAALKNARLKYCNNTKPDLRVGNDPDKTQEKNPKVLDIIALVANYAKSMVDDALKNKTEFCEDSFDVGAFQRARCGYYGGYDSCPRYYKSTKSGPVKYSTQHRPIIVQSTKHDGRGKKYQWHQFRASNVSEETATEAVRSKREVEDVKVNENITVKDENSNNEANVKNDVRMNTTIKLDKEKDMEKRRFFLRRRYSVRDEKEKAREKNWDKSNLSLDSDEKEEREQKKRREHRKPKPIVKEEDNEDVEINIDTHKAAKQSKASRLHNRPRPHRVEQPRSDGPVPRTVPLSKANEEFYAERRWPGGVVRYVIKEDPNYDMDDLRRRLNEVNDILVKNTCARIQEIREEDAEKYTDYLVLDTSADYVTGRVGGRQNFGCLELFRGGQHKQHAAMMVMAMLGFYFEVARHDRDKYVRVHMRHIRPDKLHHFEKIRKDATLPVPYDYKSATHPAWQFWRKIGKTGISSVATYKEQDPDGSIMKSFGQNDQLLSDLDLVKINSIYGVKCFQTARLRDYKNHKIRESKRG